MNNYWQHILLFTKRFLFLIIFYAISRLFFYVLNAAYFNDISWSELILLFIAGIRFDVAAIAFTNLFLLLILFPGAYKNNITLQKVFTILFLVVNCLVIMTNFIDARFFDFINKRSTSAIFSLMGANRDTWLMLPRFIVDYWYVVLVFLIVMAGFVKLTPVLNFKKIINEKMSWLTFSYQIVIVAFISGLLLLGFRGTGLKPLGITNAANYTALKNVPLVINTPFSIIKTVENENLNEQSYFKTDTLHKIYNPIHRLHSASGFNKKNIVIFILESSQNHIK